MDRNGNSNLPAELPLAGGSDIETGRRLAVLVLHIHSIYVEPSHRGEGIGQRLLEAVLEWGRGKGCVEAELSVLARNPANKLYENAGFEVFELEMRLGL